MQGCKIALFENLEELGIGNHCRLHNLSQAGTELPHGQRAQHIDIANNELRLAECADHIFIALDIHAIFTPDAGIDLAQQRRRDKSELHASHIHRKTYIGAMPGRIVTALTQVGVRNPLMLLDEIDKLTRDSHGDPSSALLEVLDPEQNKFFRDHFVEMPFDLSDTLFICTANSLDTIPKPLLDRMEVIQLPSYTKNEKISIALNHLVPKQLKKHGLTKRTLKITEGAVAEIIDYYTREAGVRNLERSIASLCRKAAKRLVEETETKRITVDAADVGTYLGARKLLPERIAVEDEVPSDIVT